MAECLTNRRNYLLKELQAAIDNDELDSDFTAEELSNMILGTLNRDLLNRRLMNDNRSHEQVSNEWLTKLLNHIRKN